MNMSVDRTSSLGSIMLAKKKVSGLKFLGDLLVV